MAQVRACLLIVILLLSSVVGRAAGEPWSEDFTPPPGDYSWVQLDTGEWLKGEIIALYDETLVFDSDHFGDLQIDLDDILHIYGRGIFALTFRDGAAIRGQLNIRGQSIIIEKAGENLEFRSSYQSRKPSNVNAIAGWATLASGSICVRVTLKFPKLVSRPGC
jgi:hypothetical protein